MAAESRAVPYDWDTAASPPADVLNLVWTDVGVNIECYLNQIGTPAIHIQSAAVSNRALPRNGLGLMWKLFRSAVDSLDKALEHLETSEHARSFTEAYAGWIVGLMVQVQPMRIGSIERSRVINSLLLSCEIAAKDIRIQVQRGGYCKLIDNI